MRRLYVWQNFSQLSLEKLKPCPVKRNCERKHDTSPNWALPFADYAAARWKDADHWVRLVRTFDPATGPRCPTRLGGYAKRVKSPRAGPALDSLSSFSGSPHGCLTRTLGLTCQRAAFPPLGTPRVPPRGFDSAGVYAQATSRTLPPPRLGIRTAAPHGPLGASH